MPGRIEEVDALFPPGVPVLNHLELLTMEGMKRMGYAEKLCFTSLTLCS
jgi:hypothetical protein